MLRALGSSALQMVALSLVVALVPLACGEDANDETQTVDLPTGPTATTDLGSFEVAWQSEPETVVRNEFFTMTVVVRDAETKAPLGSDTQLIVDAFMPEHGHGMDTTPVATASGESTWHVEGMLLHMPGDWEVTMTVNDGGRVETAVFPIAIE